MNAVNACIVFADTLPFQSLLHEALLSLWVISQTGMSCYDLTSTFKAPF